MYATWLNVFFVHLQTFWLFCWPPKYYWLLLVGRFLHVVSSKIVGYEWCCQLKCSNHRFMIMDKPTEYKKTYHITAHHITSHHNTSQHISYRIVSYHVISYHIITSSHHNTSQHITSQYFKSYPIPPIPHLYPTRTLPYHTTPQCTHHITSHHSTSHHIISYIIYHITNPVILSLSYLMVRESPFQPVFIIYSHVYFHWYL